MLAILLVLSAAVCPPGDIAQGQPATGSGLHGDLSVITSPRYVPEGTVWDTPQAVKIDQGGELVIDLGELRPVQALMIEADNDDEYAIDGSYDGLRWTELWIADPDFTGFGMRTRHVKLQHAVEVRTLRVRPRNGDGNYSVARVRALCVAPPEWENEWLQKLSPIRWWRRLNNDTIVQFKGVVALSGALLLLWGAVLEWRKRADRFRRLRDALLVALAVISCSSWFNLWHFHFEGFVHHWEFYHYYLGAKYFPEIGYTRLYECTTAAELQVVGRAQLEGRQIRNLITNHLESAAPILDHPEQCTNRFSPDRWKEFVSDVMFFRNLHSRDKWNDIIHDHGYNATPVWGIFGRLFASFGPATRSGIEDLAALDPILLILMWCFALWAFGWRATSVAMAWWGTNYAARYLWNGGAYLRMDWLAFAVIGICLVRKKKMAAGGALLTTSALLRVFPGFIVGGLICKAAWELIREKKIRQETKRFVVGCVVALAILVPISVAVCGVDAYPAFVFNSKKHLATALTNNMGWKTWVAYEHESRVAIARDGRAEDPFASWMGIRRRVFEQRKAIFLVGVVAFLALLTWSVRKRPDWVALALGVGLIPIATELTCYYYSVFLIFGFLWARERLIGVLLLLLSAFTCLTPGLRPMEDESFYWISIAVVLFSAAAAVLVGIGKTGDEPVLETTAVAAKQA